MVESSITLVAALYTYIFFILVVEYVFKLVEISYTPKSLPEILPPDISRFPSLYIPYTVTSILQLVNVKFDDVP